jgi:hypothetical protein
MQRVVLVAALLTLAAGLVATGEERPAQAGKAFLLRGSAGDLPSETGTEATVVTKAEHRDLGGPALKIELADSFGQKVAAVADWAPFTALRLDVVNPGAAEAVVELSLFHAGTKNFATRVVVPIRLKPGKNAVRIPLADLKNTNGSAPDLANVRRWYVATTGKPVSLFVGDVWLEGTGGPTKTYAIKTDPKRLERLKATKLPRLEKPILFNTPEADAVMAAVEVFPPDNPRNTLIEDWPVHPNSARLIAGIGADRPLRYNDDLAFVIVPPDQKRLAVKLTVAADESDRGPYPVPENVPIEGWPAAFQRNPKTRALTLDEAQRGKPTLDADRHAIVLDPVNRKLYEFYRLTRTHAGWTAEQASVFDLASNRLRPDGWTSSDAAGLPLLPAVVRFDELQRGVIDHPLRFTVRRTRRAYVYPATHFASRLTDENLPRMGERFRLRKDFDTSGFSREVRVILEALKRYGMIVADNGMDWGLSVSADERVPVLHDELRKVRGSDFEVVTPPPGYVPPR